MPNANETYAGWTIGMTVYVRWAGDFRQGTLTGLRDRDDGSQDLGVPFGCARVYLPPHCDCGGARNILWDDIRSSLDYFPNQIPLS